MSTNPWKITSELKTVASTREEYTKHVEQLAGEAPSKSEKPSRDVSAQTQLVAALRSRVDTIDNELQVNKSDLLRLSMLTVITNSECRRSGGSWNRKKYSELKRKCALHAHVVKHVVQIIYTHRTLRMM